MPRNGAICSPLDVLADRLSAHGLRVRGAFRPAEGDGVPLLAGGMPAATVVLIGNAGPEMWRHFSAQWHGGGSDPLDSWSRATIGDAAAQAGGEAVFPFDGPPWLPFQRWAQRAEGLRPSPLGVLIHPEYGLWHAYRGAVLFAAGFDVPRPVAREHPCDDCRARPCIAACPAGALDEGYDVPACAAHVAGADGGPCRTAGCLARRACPVGAEWAYDRDQAAFHMAAFRRHKFDEE
jgi:hypothetical protein